MPGPITKSLPNSNDHAELVRVINQLWQAIGNTSQQTSQQAQSAPTPSSGLAIVQAPVVTPGMSNPMRERGDMIYGETSGSQVRLPIGSDGQALLSSDGRPLWSDIRTLPPYSAANDGKVLGVVAASPEWIDPPGVTPAYTKLDPDCPPSTPSALDDEFDSTSLDAKWTTVNWSSLPSKDFNTTVPSSVWGSMTAASGTIPCLMQAIPAGDFTVYSKVAMALTGSTSGGGVGLILSSTNTTGTGVQTLLMRGNFTSVTDGVQVYNWTGFNTTVGVQSNTKTAHLPYLRIRRSGTNYYWGFSEDGKTWSEVLYNPGTTPAYFGLFFYNNSANRSDYSVEFFRYSGNSTATLGRSVQVSLPA